MHDDLPTKAERFAFRAQSLPAFGGVNLHHIRREVTLLLGQIGRLSIFDQYSKHDISHVDEMLRHLEWLVPPESTAVMSDADWLMIVLSIYFHDMGMLVTAAEFEARSSSDFVDFCNEQLFSGTKGKDYRAKVDTLDENRREQFLFQEYVRSRHGERIKNWICGERCHFPAGPAQAAAEEVRNLLRPLSLQFRLDLGHLCESHHLDDLDDFEKYKTAQPYGNSDAETANLHYCAILLRTADLLHITRDRTPAVEFRLINPSDPISQLEWAKQTAVTRVKSKKGVNAENIPDEKAHRDTVEVYAFFEREEGFFGLTSYLSYAGDQLKKSFDWTVLAQKKTGSKHEFPWKKIDDANIVTQGFLRQAFQFTLDQEKILDLLTGHTLYNDINVVLRELTQNALDAIRLQFHPSSPQNLGKVEINWNTAKRILEVKDNGTGMTQHIINEFLLKVGSSRYQDADFIKNYPSFHSISRFGIGVLSAFMIADNVEIISCHPEEDKARRLSLRSVHGKYLLNLLDRTDPDVKEIGSHGTLFRLHVRASVNMPDVLETARKWIVVPECDVIVRIDSSEPIPIGYLSPGDAIKGFLDDMDFEYTTEHDEIPHASAARVRIVEKSHGEIHLAFAVVWDAYFREWSFLGVNTVMRGHRHDEEEVAPPLLGTCVQGIRIVPDSPGFEGYPVVALVNVKGEAAPKTNVARSGLETTPQRDAMLAAIYELYSNHVTEEINQLVQKHSFSPAWATGETQYILGPLFDIRSQNRPLNPSLLNRALQNIQCVMVEMNGVREAKSASEIAQISALWTVECELIQSIQSLLRQVASNTSISEIIKSLNIEDFDLPSDPIVLSENFQLPFVSSIFERKEVNKISVSLRHRRVDLRWVNRGQHPRWVSLHRDFDAEISRISRTSHLMFRFGRSIHVPVVGSDLEISVPNDEVVVNVTDAKYLVPNTKIANFTYEYIRLLFSERTTPNLIGALSIVECIDHFLNEPRELQHLTEEALRIRLRNLDITHRIQHFSGRVEDLIDVPEFKNVIVGTNWRQFSSVAWRRNNSDDDIEF